MTVENPNSKPWYLKLHWQVVIALGLGVAFGWRCRRWPRTSGFLGDLFLRLLKMIIIPLIFTSLVSGVASLGDARRVGRVGVAHGGLLHHNHHPRDRGRSHPGQPDQAGRAISSWRRTGALPEGFHRLAEPCSVLDAAGAGQHRVGAMAEGEVLPVIVFAILFGVFLTRLNGSQRGGP